MMGTKLNRGTKRLILLLSLLILMTDAGCTVVSRYADPIDGDLSLKMERKACYGNCPVFTLEIAPDGKMTFDGKQHTTTIGKAESQLSKQQMDDIIAEVRRADFFGLKDDYGQNSKECPMLATDMPSVFLTIKVGNRTKTIDHYHGCFIDDEPKPTFTDRIFPQDLYKLETKIEQIADIKKWVK